MLREQLRALQQGVQACIEPYRMALGRARRSLSPAAVDTALTQDIATLQQDLQFLATDTAALRDPATRRAAINALDLSPAYGQDDEAPETFDPTLLVDALGGASPLPPAQKSALSATASLVPAGLGPNSRGHPL